MSYRKRHGKIVPFKGKDKDSLIFLATKKVYVSYMCYGYASWLKPLGFNLTYDIKEADLVLFAGGEDIGASLYGEKSNSVWTLKRRDDEEVKDYEYAVNNGIPMWGTCRGIQLLCALNGGSLIQNVDHDGSHSLHTYDGSRILTNSLHHQLCNPFNLSPEDYKILAWCDKNYSPIYEMYRDPKFKVPDNFIEPEILYFPKTQSIGMQGHPEMMYSTGRYVDSIKWIGRIFLEFYNGVLDDELKKYSKVFEDQLLPKEDTVTAEAIIEEPELIETTPGNFISVEDVPDDDITDVTLPVIVKQTVLPLPHIQ